jgi:chloride channel 3/4/5
MSHTFSIKTMWRSFFCALMATVTLSVRRVAPPQHLLTNPPAGDEPLPHGQARTFPSHLRPRLALFRDHLLRHPRGIRRTSLLLFPLNGCHGLKAAQGLYGAFVVKFNLQVAAFRRKHLASHGVAEAVVLATLTAMIGYSNQFLRIDMTESMSILFRECDNGGNVNNVCQSVTYSPAARLVI